jgi:putative ATPase
MRPSNTGVGCPSTGRLAEKPHNAVDWVTPLPEGVYPIVEATLYLAAAPKSNVANDYFKAYAKVEAEGNVQVPQHLQDANRDARDPSAGSGQALGHGEGYVYPHMEPSHHVGQQYLPMTLLGTCFFFGNFPHSQAVTTASIYS